MTAFTELPDLARRDLGGAVVAANDEFFAAAGEPGAAAPRRRAHRVRPQGQGVRRLGDPAPPRARATTGRSSGSARPGSCAGVVVDTAFFTGNYPTARLGRGRRGRGPPVGRGAGRRPTGSRCCRVGRWPATPANAFAVDRPTGGTPTSGCASTPTAGSPGCGCTARSCPTRGWSTRGAVRPGRAGERRPGDRRSATPTTAARTSWSAAAWPGTMGEGWETARRRDHGQRLGRRRAGRRGRGRAWPSWTPPTSWATRRARPRCTGRDRPTATRGRAAAPHPAAARHPAPVRAGRRAPGVHARPAGRLPGRRHGPAAALGPADRRRPGRAGHGAGSTRCPTSPRWRCWGRWASTRARPAGWSARRP